MFLVPLLVILLSAGALGWQLRQAYRTVAELQETDQSMAETLLIERLIVDQETGLRGFQTTGNSLFLQPYQAADQQLSTEFDRARTSAHDRARESAITEVENLHDTWEQAFVQPLIVSIRAGATTSDLDLNLIGKRQVDEMRQRLQALIAAKERQRNDDLERWRRQTHFMTLALLLFALVIGLTIGLYSRRQLQAVSNAFRQSTNILRVRAEQTFRSEQKLRTTLQSIADGVITCDAEGRVDTMNDVAQQLTGWTAAEAHDQPIGQVFHVLDSTTLEPVENPVTRVQQLDPVTQLVKHGILIRKDRQEILVDESAAPIRDKQGKIIGIVLVFRDVTIAIKSQEALLANEKLAVAGRLAATIAHEIHNPLDSVSNLLFLMDGESTPEESAQFLQLAKLEIARVTQISRAMLSLYREAKVPIAIDLKEMLESILLLMDRRFVSLGVTVEPDLIPGLVIYGFPAELRQVFTNLLTNAAEASGADTVIRLRCVPCSAGVTVGGLRHEAGAVVTITDQGPGIAEEIRGSLFQPFHTTKGERGTGLGLWVSRGIVNKHGGTIELDSNYDSVDHGTVARVFLAIHPVIHAGVS